MGREARDEEAGARKGSKGSRRTGTGGVRNGLEEKKKEHADDEELGKREEDKGTEEGIDKKGEERGA